MRAGNGWTERKAVRLVFIVRFLACDFLYLYDLDRTPDSGDVKGVSLRERLGRRFAGPPRGSGLIDYALRSPPDSYESQKG